MYAAVRSWNFNKVALSEFYCPIHTGNGFVYLIKYSVKCGMYRYALLILLEIVYDKNNELSHYSEKYFFNIIQDT